MAYQQGYLTDILIKIHRHGEKFNRTETRPAATGHRAPHQAYGKSAATMIVCGHAEAHQNILARAIDRDFLSFICRLCLRFLLARRVWDIQAPVYSGACFLSCPVSPDRRAATVMLCLLVLQNPRPVLFLSPILGAAGGALCFDHVCACGKRFLYHGMSAHNFCALWLYKKAVIPACPRQAGAGRNPCKRARLSAGLRCLVLQGYTI